MPSLPRFLFFTDFCLLKQKLFGTFVNNFFVRFYQKMKQRLEQFLSAENISQTQFAESIGVARAAISHILSGRNLPSYDFILNTIKAFPSLNIEWLLTGEGKMYKGDGLASPPPPRGKNIKKIVVFYEDNTFKEFKSEE